MDHRNGFEETPLRRSRRNEKSTIQELDTSAKGVTVVENTCLRRTVRKPMNKKSKDHQPKIELTIPSLIQGQVQYKTTKDIKEKLKFENGTTSLKFKSTSNDSDTNSGLNLKEEGLSVMAETSTKTDLETQPSIDFNSTYFDIQVTKSSKNPKMQSNKKRKAKDLMDSSMPSEEKSISKKKLTSKNILTKFQDENEPLLKQIKNEEMLSEGNNDSAFIRNVNLDEKTIWQVLARHEFDAGCDSKTLDRDSSSESDWEEVEERTEMNLEDYNPIIPKDGIEITINCPGLNVGKRKKKQFDHIECIRLYINRERKEHQLNIHKTHILCLLAHGLFVNNVLNLPNLKALALSYLPSDILTLTTGRKIDKANSNVIRNLVSWFCKTFNFENKQLPFFDFQKSMHNYFQEQKSLSPSEYNLMFIVFARLLGFETRFCVSLYPVTHKAQNLLKKTFVKKNNTSTECNLKVDSHLETIHTVKKISKKKSIASVKDKEFHFTLKEDKRSRLQRSTSKRCSDSVKTIKIKQEKKACKKISGKPLNRNVLSSDSESDSEKNCSFENNKIICWCEVFSKPDKQWISIECTHTVVDKPYDIEKLLPQPVIYILSYDNNCYIKDLTKRYCNEYMTSTLKLRADSDWWEETLEYFAPPNSRSNKEEEKKLDEMLENKPLPKTIGEYKNHPLYALKRHLLKFEAIYPPDAAPVGFIREEPVYARDNVCKLHSRETWVKEARVVRVGEEPYKIVKARPKWDRMAGTMRTDLPLEVFGFWQTDQYEPPIAEGGKVPRNEYGNVELFKPCMLPRGTVHLQIPGLNRIAKKLGIDCSPAVVGFDGHKGSIHPVFDGFVVCKEFKDTLLAAWDEQQVNARQRDKEKKEKRIYGNWKKLIKGLLIRERIKLKYGTK